MTGSLMTMPMLIINMGAEMIYVLDQRLKAQNIPRDKSSKVLEDIIKTMHNEQFMAELFKPHYMYSNGSTRQIFDRLAHSSIMRLNTNSMDKLYDLMRMGFKYQVLACPSAEALVHVTLTHLITIKRLIDADDVKRLIDETILLTTQTFGSMSPADFALLRQYLLRFFQDTRIKVSLFLQSGIQQSDGTLAIRADGVTATGGCVPGTVQYFADGDNATDNDTFLIASADGAVDAPRGHVLEADAVERQHLGVNMYDADAKRLSRSDGDAGSTLRSLQDAIADAKCSSGGGGGKTHKPPKLFKATAADSFNLLADLLGSSTSTASKDAGETSERERSAFKINLFPDDAMRSSSKRTDDDDDSDSKAVPTIWIDASSDHKSTTATLVGSLQLDDDDDRARHEHKRRSADDDDDLLDLMDSTTVS